MKSNVIILLSIFILILDCSGSNGSSTNRVIKDKNHIIAISVNADRVENSFKNLAGGVNLVDASKEDLDRFLSKVGTNLFRIKIWTWKIKESLNYFESADGVDYIKELKSAVDAVHNSGGKVMMQFYGMPRWLSTCDNAKCNSRLSNNIPEYSKYPPKDYTRWQELVSGMMKRLKERGVQIDYFEIYGEPNFGSTWWGNGNISSAPSFFEHYRKTDEAIRKIFPVAKVGGAAFGSISTPLDLNSSSRYSRWIKGFIDFVKTNNIQLDFFSWHLYSPLIDIFSQDAKTIRDYLDSQGLSNVPLFLTEWGVDTGTNLRQKANTHFGASFAVAALMEISHSVNDGQTFYCLGGNLFGLITEGHQPKASFNAFQLYSMLKGDEIMTKSDEKGYIINKKIKRKSVDFAQKDIKVVATRDSEGISILLTYYLPVLPREDPNYLMSRRVNLTIDGVPFTRYIYKIYQINNDHSNGYSGGNPDLVALEDGGGEGIFQKELDIPIYSVVLVRVTQK